MKTSLKNFTGMFLMVTCAKISITTSKTDADTVMCLKTTLPLKNICHFKPRRYDVSNFGIGDPYFHGWVDVQGLGVANDFCRIVGSNEKPWLSCALAGTHGESDTNYNSSKSNFDLGLTDTWYMKDEDGDGRADYCRCLEKENKSRYSMICTKAGIRGFSGSVEEGGQSNAFEIPNSQSCEHKRFRPEFGIEYRIPLYHL